MKYCVSTYSFGGYMDSLGIYGVIDKAAEMGFDGIEFVDMPWMNASDEELVKIGQYARDKGVETVDLCTGADFINGSDGDVEAQIARVCDRVDKAVLLGVKMMRHDVGSEPRGRKHGLGYAYNLERLAYACRKVTEYAASKGIQTMTENHGYYSQDADRVASLIDAVDHDNFGALLDLGNFMCADEDPVLSVSRLAPYAVHVHCKDFLYRKGNETNPGATWFKTRGGNYLRGTIVGHGEANIAQSLAILKSKGYDGYISLEFEGVEDNLRGISLGIENVKRFWENA